MTKGTVNENSDRSFSGLSRNFGWRRRLVLERRHDSKSLRMERGDERGIFENRVLRGRARRRRSGVVKSVEGKGAHALILCVQLHAVSYSPFLHLSFPISQWNFSTSRDKSH